MSIATKSTGTEQNTFDGEYVGVVESIDDPKKFYRIQVRVYGVFTDKVPAKDLPWAEIKLPVGCRPNDGHAMPLKKGDLVWVDFPYGSDTRRPRITGSVHYCPENHPNLPHEAWAGPDAFHHKRAGEEPAPAAHKYCEDEASTQNGVTVERNLDGSFAVYQRKTGTEVCIDKDGNITLHSEKDIYRSAKGNSKAVIIGNETEYIEGEQKTTAMKGVEHDGGSGSPKGNVQGDCICSYSGKPHAMISSNVKSSL
jgi:hypothetical protein